MVLAVDAAADASRDPAGGGSVVDDHGPGLAEHADTALPAGPRPSECGSHSRPRWYVAMTHRGAERLAADELRKQDIQSFLPLRKREPRPVEPGHRRHRKADPAEPVMVPAYPRYLFVLFDLQRDPWRRICSTRGVKHLFGSHPERPTPVPDKVMAAMLMRASKWGEEARQKPDPMQPLAKGAVVVIAAGLLSGSEGIVVECSGKRTKLLVLAWGREIEAPREDLRLVEDRGAAA